MKYYLQVQTVYNGRRKWLGVEMAELASDYEAMDYLREHCGRVERASPKPSEKCFRIIDGTDAVIATFSPNVNKLAVG